MAAALFAFPGEPVRAAEALTESAGKGAADAAVSRMIDGFLAGEPLERPAAKGRCLLVPAVTDGDAGAVAGKAVAQLATDIDRVILLAARPPAAPAVPALALPAWESMRTALGVVPVDAEALAACAAYPGVTTGGSEGPADQAMAAVLPFLQRRLPRAFRLVPIDAAAGADPAVLSQAIGPLLSAERTALVVVTTAAFAAAELQSLFAPAEGTATAEANAMPAALLALRALAGDFGWKPVITGLASPADGRALLSAVLVEDLNRVDLLEQATKAAWDDPLTQAAFQDASRAASRTNFQGDLLSQPEQAILLHLARSSILAKLNNQTPPPPPLYSDTLARPSGCFVTISLAGKLRGCLGTVLPKEPLSAAVQHYALAAAFEDKRFQPLTVEELAAAAIEIGALTPPAKLAFRDGKDLLGKLRPGIDGVLITFGNGTKSTFLPQVWKQFPDRETFLKALCRKGAIPLDAWQDPAKVTVEVYQSFDFREPLRTH
jgi:AmmeMemoRadiSam system protein A